MYICVVCKEEVFFGERGWVHSGGGTYYMKCLDCGYKSSQYPYPVSCPACGSKRWVDWHAIKPVWIDKGPHGRAW